MTASAGEFVRGLRAAFPQLVRNGEGRFSVRDGATALDIEFAAIAPLRLGSLELPRLHVGLRFEGGTPEAQAAMLEHLDRCTHRGGG